MNFLKFNLMVSYSYQTYFLNMHTLPCDTYIHIHIKLVWIRVIFIPISYHQSSTDKYMYYYNISYLHFFLFLNKLAIIIAKAFWSITKIVETMGIQIGSSKFFNQSHIKVFSFWLEPTKSWKMIKPCYLVSKFGHQMKFQKNAI